MAWPKLISLRIVAVHGDEGPGFDEDGYGPDKEYLDPGFLGKPEEDCRHDQDYSPQRYDNEERDFFYSRGNPCINDLRELQNLELYCISVLDMMGSSAGIVSDSLVYEALMGMNHLTSLKIWERRPHHENITKDKTSDLSANAIRCLKATLSGTRINVSSNEISLFKYLDEHLHDFGDYDHLADLKFQTKKLVSADKILSDDKRQIRDVSGIELENKNDESLD